MMKCHVDKHQKCYYDDQRNVDFQKTYDAYVMWVFEAHPPYTYLSPIWPPFIVDSVQNIGYVMMAVVAGLIYPYLQKLCAFAANI